jgi:transposase InsO family protein
VAHARAKLTPVWPAPAGRSGAGVRVDGRGGAGRRRFPGPTCYRLSHIDRPSGIPVRFERARPGELLHLHVKKLGRIPPGGVHRMRGRSTETDRFRKRHRPGYDYLHVAVDDHSRVAFVRVFSDEQGETAARFLLEAAGFFADRGIRIERVLTDRHNSYRLSRSFQQALQRIGARHKLTRGYRPQTNGKAERLIRAMLAEWAYVRLYRANEERLRVLPAWIDFYNSSRPHIALGGHPSMARLSTDVGGNHT